MTTESNKPGVGAEIKFSGVIAGAPVEVGAQVFRRMCMPLVRAASLQAPPEELAQLYCGFFSAAFGSLVADFGQEQALQMVEALFEAFGRMDVDAAARVM